MIISKELFGVRRMKKEDKADVMRMMQVFYASEAIMSDASEDVFLADFRECISPSPFVEGFIFTDHEGNAKGYSMIAHSYSTEFGKPCVWIEDMYFEEDLRGLGAARAFFDYLNEEYPGHTHRLEADRDNAHAIEVYRRSGFREVPYIEFIRNI